jgi:hypothetical protein
MELAADVPRCSIVSILAGADPARISSVERIV